MAFTEEMEAKNRKGKQMSVNKVILVGRVGRDIETKQTSGGIMAKFSIATEDAFKSKSGAWEKETDWHRIVVFGQPAEYAANTGILF